MPSSWLTLFRRRSETPLVVERATDFSDAPFASDPLAHRADDAVTASPSRGLWSEIVIVHDEHLRVRAMAQPVVARLVQSKVLTVSLTRKSSVLQACPWIERARSPLPY